MGDERRGHRRQENKYTIHCIRREEFHTYRMNGEQETLKITFAAIITVAVVCRLRLAYTLRGEIQTPTASNTIKELRLFYVC